MNSFHLTAIGRLASDPATGSNGDVKFALIGEDYAGKNREPVKTTVFFVAFNGIGEAIAAHAKKGDQLIVDAQLRANNYEKDGKTVYDYSYIVQGFKYGNPGLMRRAELNARQKAPPAAT
jgi:single-stranded DNA-binding protein